jgi:threonylcarbamoyladenosine tRNA methylthiotransferase MtaB
VEGETLATMNEVDLVVGLEDRARLVDLVESGVEVERHPPTKRRPREFQEMDIQDFEGLARAVVKVQEGCDAFCSFCIVPFARGRSRSRLIPSVVDQVRRLSGAGYQEIVLTGVHLGDYGSDRQEGGLLELLRAVEGVPDLVRYRLSSLEPTCITPEIVEFLASSAKFCHHLHIPLQSGDDGILRDMRRPYVAQDYVDLVETLVCRMPDIGIGVDAMVGFPGESEEAFQRTHELIERVPAAYLHVFPYSPRPGTPAAKRPDQLHPDTKKARAAALRQLGDRKARAFRFRFLGRTMDAVIEGRREADTGLLQGVTGNYIRVFAAGPDFAMNRLWPVRLESHSGNRVVGRIVDGRVPCVGSSSTIPISPAEVAG